MIVESDNGRYENRNGDEPPGSRPHRRSDFHLRFHPFADPFGGTAVRDESLGRVPHYHLFVAEQIQIFQQFWAEGSTLTRSTRLPGGSLLRFSIRTDRIVRGGEESESRHPLSFEPSALVISSGNQLTLSPIRYQLQGQAHEASTGAQQLGSQADPHDEPHDEPHPLPEWNLGRRIFGQRSFGIRIFGHRSFGILKQLCPLPQPSPQLFPQPTGAQQLGSATTPQPLPQPAGAQQLGSVAAPQPAGAQQLGSVAVPQPAGAQQLASAGAQQLGSGAHPWCLLNRPACTLLAIENTTIAAVSVNAFIENLLDIVL